MAGDEEKESRFCWKLGPAMSCLLSCGHGASLGRDNHLKPHPGSLAWFSWTELSFSAPYPGILRKTAITTFLRLRSSRTKSDRKLLEDTLSPQ